MNNLRENMGGIVSIVALSIIDIQTWPALSQDGTEYEAAITLKSGKVWYDMLSSANFSDFTESAEDTDSGVVYKSSVNISIPKFDSDSVSLNLVNKPAMILKITDANGVSFIMGDPTRPVTIMNNRNSGRIPSDRNEFKIEISHSAPFPCPLYDF
jgi:hypothetical protein